MHYTRASEANGCQAVQFLKCPQYKCTIACKKKRGAAERFPAPHGGVDFSQRIPHRLQKFMLFFYPNLQLTVQAPQYVYEQLQSFVYLSCNVFRKVNHNEGVTRRTTKVSLHIIFTLFIIYIIITTPYQGSFTVPAIHFFIQGELIDILPSSSSSISGLTSV